MHVSGAGKQWYFVLLWVVVSVCSFVLPGCMAYLPLPERCAERRPRLCAGQGQCCALTPRCRLPPQQDLDQNHELAPYELLSTAAWRCLPFANGCGWIRPKLPGVGVVPIPAAILCQIQSGFDSAVLGS